MRQTLGLRLVRFLGRLRLGGGVILIGISLAVGIGTGLGALLFNTMISWVSRFAFFTLPALVPQAHMALIAAVPALGGLIAGPLIYRYAREAKGHGVPEVMEAIALRGGRIRPIVVVIKAMASAFTLGTGGSVGREGPIVQIGAALGSTLGQAFRMSEVRIRTLVACGAAGGIAATFNAPIAGVIFAAEVILGELSISHIGAVVISAVTANATMQALVGSEYTFAVPEPYAFESLAEFGLYAILGALAALVAVAFVRTLYWAEDRFAEQRRIPEWLQPAIGGLMLGLLGLAYPMVFPALRYENMPHVFGGGYEPISAALTNHVAIGGAFLLIFIKMLATDFTLGSGGSGGIFAPSLFMGAMLGSAVGGLFNAWLPGLTAPPGAYALVGMGAVFAGAAHAPLTALIMLFELTGDYRIILPLMLSVVISTLIARRMLAGESIYTLKLARRGIRLRSGRDVDVLESVRAEEVMATDIDTIRADATLSDLSRAFSQARRRGFPVMDASGLLAGIVTVADLENAIQRGMPLETPVADIAVPFEDMLYAYPDESIGAVLKRMGTRGVGHIPVVSRQNPRRLIGWIWNHEIIRAYNIAVARRSELRLRAQAMQPDSVVEGMRMLDVHLAEGDPSVGLALKDLHDALPENCLFISIHRDGRTIIPHGNTMLRAGDRVTVLIDNQAADSLRSLLTQAGAQGRLPAASHGEDQTGESQSDSSER